MNWNEVLEPTRSEEHEAVANAHKTNNQLSTSDIRKIVATEQVMQDLINTLLAEQFWLPNQLQLVSAAELKEQIASQVMNSTHQHQAEVASILSAFTDNKQLQHSSWYYWTIQSSSVDQESYDVIFPVQSAIVQAYRYVPASVTMHPLEQFTTNPFYTHVYAVRYPENHQPNSSIQVIPLTPAQLMKIVNDQCLSATYREQPGVDRFVQLLEETIKQTAWSLDHSLSHESVLEQSAADFFQQMEQYAALRDRPFHPVSKAKVGLQEHDYRQYSAEFAQPMSLAWVAIKRRLVMEGEGVVGRTVTDYQLFDYRKESQAPKTYSEPIADLLSPVQQQQVIQAMQAQGLNTTEYIAIPVHPWQLKHNLPEYLATAQKQGDWVDLSIEIGQFEATSSVRSLSPVENSPHYIKLPLSVFSLGASRYLPAVKLINGQRGQTMLEQALQCDSILAKQLFLCDENRWWAYMPEEGSLFDDEPRHLAAMVRTYPEALIAGKAGARLLPMSALSVVLPPSSPEQREGHFFDDWIKERGLDINPSSVCLLFGEVCQTFFEVNLRLFRLGLMPELHGQNSVLVWQKGYIKQMLLRDHDSVRLHLPWLQEQGIDDPQYMIRPGYSNSLYNDTPAELIFYFQTLGVQVNLYAIIDALSTVYKIEEKVLWNVLRDQLQVQLREIPFREEIRSELHSILFEKTEWPLKLLVKPLLEQAGVPGSMPSGQSTIQNPFLQLDE